MTGAELSMAMEQAASPLRKLEIESCFPRQGPVPVKPQLIPISNIFSALENSLLVLRSLSD
jgi:hypothetical protein